MEYYKKKENAEEYRKMAEGYDGSLLIEKLKEYLPKDSSLLELGIGPGKDLDILRQAYKVTGSDYSQIFLDNYHSQHPGVDLLLLDATTLDTHRRYNGIYSNKVLIHLSRVELKRSISKQVAILNEPGIMLHSFWVGSGEEFISGLRFSYYSEDELHDLFKNEFDILESGQYKEMRENDSIFMILQKK